MTPMTNFAPAARFALIAMVLAAAGCQVGDADSSSDSSTVLTQADASAALQLPDGAMPLELDLPQRFQSWRPVLIEDWLALQRVFRAVAQRWPEVIDGHPEPLRLTITASPLEARFLSDRMELAGDPMVPRTHPHRRLALVTLPRDDRLLAERDLPPRSWRETVRHEMVHLLACNRPGLATAPAWFHEGLAEALVGLDPSPFPTHQNLMMGSAWAAELRRVGAVGDNLQRPLHALLAEQPAEVRYLAWSSLVLQLLQKSDSQTPWQLTDARPSLAAFLAALPDDYGRNRNLPQIFGRDVDYTLGGKNLLLASLPLRGVSFYAGRWRGEQPLNLEMRVGRTGAAMGAVILRSPHHQQVLRLRINTFGAAVASMEDLRNVGPRAFQSRPEVSPTASWRPFRFEFKADANGERRLVVSSGDYQRTFEPAFAPPYELQFGVHDGVYEIRSEQTFLPPTH